jgi:hypothetical protein
VLIQFALGRQHSASGARAGIGSPLGCQSVRSYQFYEFFNSPHMIGNARFHCGHHAQSLMHPAEKQPTGRARMVSAVG